MGNIGTYHLLLSALYSFLVYKVYLAFSTLNISRCWVHISSYVGLFASSACCVTKDIVVLCYYANVLRVLPTLKSRYAHFCFISTVYVAISYFVL